MQHTLDRSHTGNAGKAKGREFVRHNGERHYINHLPHFSVHYYPTGSSERIVYVTWEEDMIISGRNLLTVYEDLKANSPETIRESEVALRMIRRHFAFVSPEQMQAAPLDAGAPWTMWIREQLIEEMGCRAAGQ